MPSPGTRLRGQGIASQGRLSVAVLVAKQSARLGTPGLDMASVLQEKELVLESS